MKKIRIISLILAVITLSGALVCCADNSAAGTEAQTVSTGAPADTDAGKEAPETEPETAATEAETTEEQTAAAEKTAAEIFRYDNFADGKFTDKLLDSVTPGTLALLSCCMYYESELQKGIKAGQKWVYSNSSTYVPQSTSFDNMVKSGKYGTNCAMPANWAFVDMGIMNEGQRFWGESGGGFRNIDSVGKKISAVATITSWKGSTKFSTLYKEGKVQPGDIFLASGHTFIYMGDSKFLAAGHDGKWHTDSSANTEDSKKAVFDTWVCDMTSCSDWNYTVYWQISFKKEYIPKYYRNAAGELVLNPLYDKDTSIEYVAGKSSEKVEIVYPTGDGGEVFDTSGRNNVLLGKTFSVSKSFNMSSLKNPENMTDGNLYYDNTALTYTDCKTSTSSAQNISPTSWYNANGEKSDTKDDTHKYICGFYTELDRIYTVNAFSIYSQAVGASTYTPFGDIDGFDILVSTDGKNWTVAYSIENAMCEGKWTYTNDARNKGKEGYYMCHYIDAQFNGEYEAKYVMFALTQPRTQTPDKTGTNTYPLATTSANYFRISELQVYEKSAATAQ